MHVINVADRKVFGGALLEIAKEAGIEDPKYALMEQQTSIFKEEDFREVASAMAAGFGKELHIIVKPGQDLIKYDMVAGASITRNWWFAYFA